MWIIKDQQGNVLVSTSGKRSNYKIWRAISSPVFNMGVHVRYRMTLVKGDGFRIEIKKEGTQEWMRAAPEYPAFSVDVAAQLVKLFRRSVRSFDPHVKFVNSYE